MTEIGASASEALASDPPIGWPTGADSALSTHRPIPDQVGIVYHMPSDILCLAIRAPDVATTDYGSIAVAATATITYYQDDCNCCSHRYKYY